MTSSFKTNKTLKVKLILSTVVLGFVVIFSASSASAGRVNEYATSTSTSDVKTVQSQNGQKDLSELWERLKTRFSEIFSELAMIVQWQINDSFTGSTQEVHSSASISDVSINFQDIETSSYRESINILARNGVIDASSAKFYPDNYLRTYELVIMLVKSQLISSNQISDIFQMSNYKTDIVDVQNASYLPFVAYADDKWYLDRIISRGNNKRYLNPNHQITQKEIWAVLSWVNNNPEILNLTSNNKMTRAQFAEILVKVFFANENIVEEPTSQITETGQPTLLQSLLTMVAK